MDVSVQILVPALLSDNEPLVPFRQVAKWVPQSVRHVSKEETPCESNDSQEITSVSFQLDYIGSFLI